MPSKITTNKEVLFDKRVVERNIARGLITREEYNQYLESLEDASEQTIPVEAEFVHREFNKN
jgi:hypothetical protein